MKAVQINLEGGDITINLDFITIVMLVVSAVVFALLVLSVLVEVGKKRSEKVSFAGLGMAFGVGAGAFIGVFIRVALGKIGFGDLGLGLSLGFVIGGAIGLLFGAVLDAQQAKKSRC